MKVLAIGDIHTKIWIIDEVVKLIPKYDAIVFVGDYADDWKSGPHDTIKTWIALKQLQTKYFDKVKLVTGNHDFAYTMSYRPQSGGYNQVTQYLLDLPDNKKLKSWLKELPIQLYVDDVTYTHAGVDANWNTSTDEKFLWSDDSPIWNRPGTTVYGPEAQVFGHTPSKTCWEVEPNIWCIDTFSTYQDGTPIGDYTVLEIIDGKTFNKIKLETKNGNNSISSL